MLLDQFELRKLSTTPARRERLPILVLNARVNRATLASRFVEGRANSTLKLGFHGALVPLQAPQAFACHAPPTVPLRLGGLFQAPFGGAEGTQHGVI